MNNPTSNTTNAVEQRLDERAAFEKWADENRYGPKFRESMFAAWEGRAALESFVAGRAG